MNLIFDTPRVCALAHRMRQGIGWNWKSQPKCVLAHRNQELVVRKLAMLDLYSHIRSGELEKCLEQLQ
jgi:hypothetical protein